MSGTDIRLELLAAAEIEDLRRAVLALLERGEAGAAAATVRALGSARGGWTMAGRAAEGPVFGGGGTLWIAGGLADATLPDEAGAAARPIDVADAEAFCRLADALPQVAAVEPLPVSGASSPAAGRLSGVATAFGATGKHLVAVVFDAAEARAVIEMAACVAGGAEELRERPPVTLAAPPSAAVAVAETAAAAGVPCLISLAREFLTAAPGAAADGNGPGVRARAAGTGPASLARAAGTGTPPRAAAADMRGGLVDSLAAGLAAAAGVLGRVPGAALGFALPPSPRPPLDESYLVVLAALAQLSHAFGLPLLATGLATQAPAAGWLASAENTAAALTGRLAGVDGLAGAGLLAGGATASLAELALDSEIASYVAATCGGIAVDDEALAIETIQKVGIAGNYLGERHTRRHMREVWRPRFYDRTPYEQWLREGRRQSADLAGELVQRTLAEHSAPPLDAGCAAELQEIVHEVGKETR